MSAAGKQPVIFCDFDGTITENDNIVQIMKHFQPPGWEEIVQDIIGERMSIREGVGALFSLLPSSMKAEVVAYVLEQARIRAGFSELLAYIREQRIPFLVTSGGIDFFVKPLLAPYPIDPDRIYCNASDFTGERIRITWPHPCDEHCSNDCGMCKTTIIRRWPRDRYFRILIGDSVTDFAGAKLADAVFARSHLKDKCEELGIPYEAYEDFHQVVDLLKPMRTIAK